MKTSRTKNASRNIVFGVTLRMLQIIGPFTIRTVLLYCLGVEYTGLNSLFTAILSVLNLAELGVGSAMVYSMYKPIAEDDAEKICSLMQLYKIYYRIIGIIIAVIGIALLPFLNFLIKGTVPNDINLYILYLFNLAATVLSYWLFAYKSSVLQAHQRADLISKCTLIILLFQYALQIFVIVVYRNYYFYIVLTLLGQIAVNLLTGFVADKKYPDYKARGILPKDERVKINQRIKDLFTSKIGLVVVNSADTIVISAFLGLSVLAIYQNYYFIMQAVMIIITIIFTSVLAGIGNSFIVETEEKNFSDFKLFLFGISWLSGLCTCFFLVLYQPFVTIWTGANMLLDYRIVVCLCISFYINESHQYLCVYKDATGRWHEDRFRSLAAALGNLGMNLIMVNYWGLYGVVISTIIANLVISSPWLLYNLFTTIFKNHSVKDYLKDMLQYVLATILICGILCLICRSIHLGPIASLCVYMPIVAIGFNALYFLVFARNKQFHKSIQFVKRILKR